MILILLFIYFSLIPKIATAQVSISEISSVTDPEWIEIYNASDSAVLLTGWKLKTETTSRNIPDNTTIGPKSYYIFESSGFLSNSTPKTVELLDQSGIEKDTASQYPADLPVSLSWSKQMDSLWCQATSSKSIPNNTCYTPTPTVTLSPSSTPTSTPPTPSSTPASTITLTPISTTTPVPTSEPIRITIDSLPSYTSLGSTFSVRFIINNATPNTDYYVKAYGGIDDNYYFQIQNGTSWYNFNSAWDNMPKFKSNSNGEINQLLFLRAKTDKETGSYKVKVKIKDPEIESEVKYITITKFIPSPTPTVPEPSPTEIVENPTPEPLATENQTVDETPDSVKILGLSDGDSLSLASSSNRISQSRDGSILPVILISVGGVLLLVPLLVSKIRDGR